jgi:hypothetical protein
MRPKQKIISLLKRFRTLKALANLVRKLIFIRAYKRRQFALSYFRPQMKYIRTWMWKKTENSNFYYDITELNKEHLAHLLSHVLNTPHAQIQKYFSELESDLDLRNDIEIGLRKYGNDFAQIEFGRRIGWYAIVRATKPKLVVETGVHHGVGACVLTKALLRNRAEGCPGSYLGTDINPDAGQLFTGKYKSVGEIMFGDSIESLNKIDEPIDLFINDSDHSAAYESNEYETVTSLLSSNSILIGDNSHVTSKLSEYSRKYNREFLFFSEKPKNHWYPGAGIGISFGRNAPKQM